MDTWNNASALIFNALLCRMVGRTCDLEIAGAIAVVFVALLIPILLPSSKRLNVKGKRKLVLRLEDINGKTKAGLSACASHASDGSWRRDDWSHVEGLLGEYEAGF